MFLFLIFNDNPDAVIQGLDAPGFPKEMVLNGSGKTLIISILKFIFMRLLLFFTGIIDS